MVFVPWKPPQVAASISSAGSFCRPLWGGVRGWASRARVHGARLQGGPSQGAQLEGSRLERTRPEGYSQRDSAQAVQFCAKLGCKLPSGAESCIVASVWVVWCSLALLACAPECFVRAAPGCRVASFRAPIEGVGKLSMSVGELSVVELSVVEPSVGELAAGELSAGELSAPSGPLEPGLGLAFGEVGCAKVGCSEASNSVIRHSVSRKLVCKEVAFRKQACKESGKPWSFRGPEVATSVVIGLDARPGYWVHSSVAEVFPGIEPEASCIRWGGVGLEFSFGARARPRSGGVSG